MSTPFWILVAFITAWLLALAVLVIAYKIDRHRQADLLAELKALEDT